MNIEFEKRNTVIIRYINVGLAIINLLLVGLFIGMALQHDSIDKQAIPAVASIANFGLVMVHIMGIIYAKNLSGEAKALNNLKLIDVPLQST